MHFRFVFFQPKNTRKNIGVDDLTANMLVKWRNVELWVLVHVYSITMSSSAVFTSANNKLIKPALTDRSNADAHVVLQAAVLKLKEVHSNNYVSSDINWTIWAQKILTAEPHMQEHMYNEPPPGRIIELFHTAPIHPSSQLQNLRANLTIGANVAASMKQYVADVEESFQHVEHIHRNYDLAMRDLGSRIKLLKVAIDSSSNVLEMASEACQENEFSLEAYSSVTNAPDVDHQEF